MIMTIEGNVNKGTLDSIIDVMTNVIENSKDEIFHINEEALRERTQLQRELEETRIKVKKYMVYVDDLHKEVKTFKHRLSVVSREFNVYTEEDIREVYGQTHALQRSEERRVGR